MNGYLLDTSVIIDYIQGRENAVRRIKALEGDLAASFVSLAELYDGVYRSRETQKVEKIVLGFWQKSSNEFGLDEEICCQFGKIRTNLKKRGLVIEDLDILIAATCLAHDLTLVTASAKHFDRIEGLRLKSVSST